VRAFEFFGGAPAQLVPDNLKAWEKSASSALIWQTTCSSGTVRRRTDRSLSRFVYVWLVAIWSDDRRDQTLTQLLDH